MKRCPTCGNTYTNDRLVFCLEDGASLVDVTESVEGFDAEKTLHIPLEETQLPPAEALKARGGQTVRSPAQPQTAPPRPRPHTTGGEPDAPPSKSSSPFLVAAITAIVVLLLVIAGIGVALLMRGSSENDNASTRTENGSNTTGRNANNNDARTSNGSASNETDASSNANGANRNGPATLDAAARAEAKIVRGASLNEGDLRGLSRDEMRRLRNTVYARHGRMFDSADLQRYFEGRPWYRPRSDYDETQLSATDRANIRLIQEAETSAS